jgi:hypothetical protein
MRLEGRARHNRKIPSVIGCAIVPWGKKEKKKKGWPREFIKKNQ